MLKLDRLLVNIFIIGCMLFSQLSYAATLRLVIPQFPPYTSERDSVFAGIGIELIEQLMQDVDVDYQLRSTPNYARALEELRRDRADGFFLASENKQRNDIAVFSEPLLVNRWSWFFPLDSHFEVPSSEFKSTARIASIHGSNTAKWLVEHNYNVTTKSNSAQLFPIMLLEKKRIDAVFLASVVFRKELELHGYNSTDYVEVVEKSKPFGIYISKAYLADRPEFMKKLNASIIKIQNLVH